MRFSRRTFKQGIVQVGAMFGIVLLPLILAACGGSSAPAAVTPAGARSGLNTFVFLYTDN